MENLTIFILLYHGNMIPYHSPLRACLHGGGGPQIVEIGAASHPTYHVNVIKLKWEIIWTGGAGYPPKRVTSPTWDPPHLHVNRPLDC